MPQLSCSVGDTVKVRTVQGTEVRARVTAVDGQQLQVMYLDSDLSRDRSAASSLGLDYLANVPTRGRRKTEEQAEDLLLALGLGEENLEPSSKWSWVLAHPTWVEVLDKARERSRSRSKSRARAKGGNNNADEDPDDNNDEGDAKGKARLNSEEEEKNAGKGKGKKDSSAFATDPYPGAPKIQALLPAPPSLPKGYFEPPRRPSDTLLTFALRDVVDVRCTDGFWAQAVVVAREQYSGDLTPRSVRLRARAPPVVEYTEPAPGQTIQATINETRSFIAGQSDAAATALVLASLGHPRQGIFPLSQVAPSVAVGVGLIAPKGQLTSVRSYSKTPTYLPGMYVWVPVPSTPVQDPAHRTSSRSVAAKRAAKVFSVVSDSASSSRFSPIFTPESAREAARAAVCPLVPRVAYTWRAGLVVETDPATEQVRVCLMQNTPLSSDSYFPPPGPTDPTTTMASAAPSSAGSSSSATNPAPQQTWANRLFIQRAEALIAKLETPLEQPKRAAQGDIVEGLDHLKNLEVRPRNSFENGDTAEEENAPVVRPHLSAATKEAIRTLRTAIEVAKQRPLLPCMPEVYVWRHPALNEVFPMRVRDIDEAETAWVNAKEAYFARKEREMRGGDPDDSVADDSVSGLESDITVVGPHSSASFSDEAKALDIAMRGYHLPAASTVQGFTRSSFSVLTPYLTLPPSSQMRSSATRSYSSTSTSTFTSASTSASTSSYGNSTTAGSVKPTPTTLLSLLSYDSNLVVLTVPPPPAAVGSDGTPVKLSRREGAAAAQAAAQAAKASIGVAMFVPPLIQSPLVIPLHVPVPWEQCLAFYNATQPPIVARSLVGASNLGYTDYLSVVAQSLISIVPIQLYFRAFLHAHIRSGKPLAPMRAASPRRATSPTRVSTGGIASLMRSVGVNPDGTPINPEASASSSASSSGDSPSYASVGDATDSLIEAIGELVHGTLKPGLNTSLSMAPAVAALRTASTRFKARRQHDAHEALVFLLEYLHHGLLLPVVEPAPSLPRHVDLSTSCEDACYKYWKSRNRSVISDVFASFTVTTFNCAACGTPNPIYGPSITCPLTVGSRVATSSRPRGFTKIETADLESIGAVGIDEAIVDTASERIIQPKNYPGFKCAHCNNTRTNRCRTRITRLPKILVFQVKRFRSARNTIDVPLAYESTIDVIGLVATDISPLQSTKYRLVSVTDYYGARRPVSVLDDDYLAAKPPRRRMVTAKPAGERARSRSRSRSRGRSQSPGGGGDGAEGDEMEGHYSTRALFIATDADEKIISRRLSQVAAEEAAEEDAAAEGEAKDADPTSSPLPSPTASTSTSTSGASSKKSWLSKVFSRKPKTPVESTPISPVPYESEKDGVGVVAKATETKKKKPVPTPRWFELDDDQTYLLNNFPPNAPFSDEDQQIFGAAYLLFYEQIVDNTLITG